MRIDKRLVIEEADISNLHAEIEDIMNFFIEHSGGSDKWVAEDFPEVQKLKQLLTTMVVSEPGDRVYERLTKLAADEQLEKNRLKKRFLSVLPPRKD